MYRSVLGSLLSVLFAASTAASDIATIDLAPGATSAPDGFLFELTAGPVEYTTKTGLSYRMIWCTFQVPKRVQQTRFVDCALQVLDSRGRALTHVPVSSWSGARGMRVLAVYLQPQFASRCRLLFRYGTPPVGSLVAEYRVPLKEHVRRSARPNQAMQRTASKPATDVLRVAIHPSAAWHLAVGSRSLILCLVRW